jgi:hypothetical protein
MEPPVRRTAARGALEFGIKLFTASEGLPDGLFWLLIVIRHERLEERAGALHEVTLAQFVESQLRKAIDPAAICRA